MPGPPGIPVAHRSSSGLGGEELQYHALRIAQLRQQDRSPPWNREGALFSNGSA